MHAYNPRRRQLITCKHTSHIRIHTKSPHINCKSPKQIDCVFYVVIAENVWIHAACSLTVIVVIWPSCTLKQNRVTWQVLRLTGTVTGRVQSCVSTFIKCITPRLNLSVGQPYVFWYCIRETTFVYWFCPKIALNILTTIFRQIININVIQMMMPKLRNINIYIEDFFFFSEISLFAAIKVRINHHCLIGYFMV